MYSAVTQCRVGVVIVGYNTVVVIVVVKFLFSSLVFFCGFFLVFSLIPAVSCWLTCIIEGQSVSPVCVLCSRAFNCKKESLSVCPAVSHI